MKKKLISVFMSVVVLTTILIGCSSTDTPASQAPAEQAPAAKEEAAPAPAPASDEAASAPAGEQLPLIGSGALTYDPNVPVNNGEAITLVFGQFDHEGGYERHLRAMQDYMAMHPNVTFDIDGTLGWGDYWTRLPISVSSGQGPDLMHFHLNWYTEFVPYLAEPFPADMKEAVLKDFNGVEPFMYGGELYTIPVGNMTGAMFYNKTLWAEAGLTDADIPKTWDQFREVAIKLTGNGVDGFEMPDGWLMLAMNYQNGHNIFEADGKHTQLYNPGMIQAAQLLQDFVHVDKISSVSSTGANENFAAGNSAMRYAWTWYASWLNGNAPNLDWGIFPTPTFDGTRVVDRNNPEVSPLVNVNAPEANKAVAMDFLRFYLASDEYQAELCDKAFVSPTKKSCVGSSVFANNHVVNTISGYMDNTVWVGILTGAFDDFVGQILNDEIILQGKEVEGVLQYFDSEMSKRVGDAEIPAAERLSSLASFLK